MLAVVKKLLEKLIYSSPIRFATPKQFYFPSLSKFLRVNGNPIFPDFEMQVRCARMP